MEEKSLGVQIKELREKGYSYSQIKLATNASQGTISYHISPNGKASTRARSATSRKVIDTFIRHSKETNPCVDCNVFYAYYIMQYDHRPEFEKKFNISKYKNHTQSIHVVKSEMLKCDLVCANCHMTRGHWRRVEANGMIDSYEAEDF
jgi:hypothetical protein